MERVKIKQIHIGIIFVLLLIVPSLPLFIRPGTLDDAATHIARVYQLAQEFQYGNFNPIIYRGCANGFGYPYGIFYPDTFLKPFAFLSFLGMDTYVSFQIMIVCINFFTLVSVYFFSKIISNDKEKRILFSILYFLFPYRIFDVYFRFSIGEILFFLFFPLVLYGIYKLFKENKFSITFFIGMWGMAHSHVLSCAIICVTLLILYVFNIKKILSNIKILLYTLVSAVFTVITSLDVILPIMEIQSKQELHYSKDPSFIGTVDSHAIKILGNLPGELGSILSLVSTVVMIAVAIWIVVFKKKYKFEVVCGVVFFLTTDLFPWKIIIKYFNQINILQFPWRLFVLMSIPMSILIYCRYNVLLKKIVIIYYISIVIITTRFSFWYFPYDSTKNEWVIGAGDYLPANAIENKKPRKYEDHIKETKKYNIYHVNNETIECYPIDNEVVIPYYYYYGYSVKYNATELQYEESDKGLIKIYNLPDKKVELKVVYSGTRIQKISYLVSTLSLYMILSLYAILVMGTKKRTSFINKKALLILNKKNKIVK